MLIQFKRNTRFFFFNNQLLFDINYFKHLTIIFKLFIIKVIKDYFIYDIKFVYLIKSSQN